MMTHSLFPIFEPTGNDSKLQRSSQIPMPDDLVTSRGKKKSKCAFLLTAPARKKPLQNTHDLRLIFLMTVLQVLQSTTAYFQKHNIESPRLNAEHLLAHVFGWQRIELYLEFERELSESELAPLRGLVKRRAKGEPLQHLLGTVEFCGRTFLCDHRAMVPRPETEQLVELLISNFKSEIANARIADVGTGSGVIALSLAAEFPKAEIVAADVSEDALAQARENAERLGLSDHVRFVRSHLLESTEGVFDMVVANLPYISTEQRQNLSREVLHDPEVALFAGMRGDELMWELIVRAPSRLRPGGILALEIGAGQNEALVSALAEKNYRDIWSEKDYSGVTRFLFARYG
jgi:release factor glutamine methyltransferase